MINYLYKAQKSIVFSCSKYREKRIARKTRSRVHDIFIINQEKSLKVLIVFVAQLIKMPQLELYKKLPSGEYTKITSLPTTKSELKIMLKLEFDPKIGKPGRLYAMKATFKAEGEILLMGIFPYKDTRNLACPDEIW